MATYTIKNPTDFANALLGALGMPDNKTNVNNVVGWETVEGGNWHNTAKFNPLNTSQPEPGSTNFQTGQSGSGVQAYTNWQQGVDATVQTLQNSDPNYGYSQILLDLNTSQPWSNFSSALKSSSWDGSGHYAGLSGTSTPGLNTPGAGNPDSQSYGTGVTITQQDGSAANSPSKSPGAKKLQGIGGILQALQDLYSPPTPGAVASLTSLGTANIQQVATLIFVRGMSSLLFIGVMAMGIKTLTSGSSGGGGGATNVLEFVNNAQNANRSAAASAERINAAKSRTESANARAEASRTAASEREAARNARAEANRNTAREREEYRNARSNRWADIHEEYATRPKKK